MELVELMDHIPPSTVQTGTFSFSVVSVNLLIGMNCQGTSFHGNPFNNNHDSHFSIAHV